MIGSPPFVFSAPELGLNDWEWVWFFDGFMDDKGSEGSDRRAVFGAMLTVLTALTVDLPVLCSGSLNRVLSGSGFNGLMAMA